MSVAGGPRRAIRPDALIVPKASFPAGVPAGAANFRRQTSPDAALWLVQVGGSQRLCAAPPKNDWHPLFPPFENRRQDGAWGERVGVAAASAERKSAQGNQQRLRSLHQLG